MGQQGDGTAIARGPIDGDAFDQVEAGQADDRESRRHAEIGKGVLDAPHGIGVGAARMEQNDLQALRREGLGHVHDLAAGGAFSLGMREFARKIRRTEPGLKSRSGSTP